ncbi:MAG: SDR family NAD(P)-dependent oxidoreductase [Chthoniobacterales bacterium]
MIDSASPKVVLVSGSSGGLGRAVCRKFSSGGWTTVGADLVASDSTQHVADLTDVAGIEHVIDAVAREHGRLDGLVVCAGVWTEGDTSRATEAEFDRVFAVNVKSAFFLLSRALPHLKATRGHATIISSDAGIQGNAGAAIYSASKGAVSNLVRAVAREVAPDLVRVNAVCPGDADTPMLHGQAEASGDPPAYLRKLLAGYPQGPAARFIKPDEVAALCWFLAQDEAAPITGANLSIDFGLSAGI